MKGKRGRWMQGRFLRACQGTFFFTFAFAFGQSPFTPLRPREGGWCKEILSKRIYIYIYVYPNTYMYTYLLIHIIQTESLC